MVTRRYHVTRAIGAPATVVWDLLTDPSGCRDWNPAVVSIEGAAAPDGLGRRDALRSLPGGRTYSLKPAGTGTEFSMSEVFTGPLSGLIARTIPDLTASFEQFADGLKAAAEHAAR